MESFINSHDVEFVRDVLLYLAKHSRQTSPGGMIATDLSIEDLDAFGELRVPDMERLAEAAVKFRSRPFVRISFDGSGLKHLISCIQHENRAEKLKLHLIRQDAPLPMMQSLFRINPRQYAALRQCYGLPQKPGRPPCPEEELELRLWTAWQAVLNERAFTQATGRDYLDVHEITEAPMRMIWHLTQRWLESGRAPDGAALAD